MRKLTAVLTVFLLLVFLLSTGMSVNYLAETQALFIADEARDRERSVDHHIIVLLPDTRDPFFASMADSFSVLARETRVGIELRTLPYTQDISEVRRALDRSVRSKPDGIVTYGSDDKEFVRLINQAEGSEIPVITVVSDAPSSTRSVFVGNNNFSIGSSAGKTIMQARPHGAKIGVILNQPDPAAGDGTTNLILSGLAEALKPSRDYKISVVRESKPGVFSGEEVAVEILTAFPDVEVLFCTSAKDTLGAAQTIIDQNRVGQVTIIGFDAQPEILDYIEKGVIFATIVRSPETMAQIVFDSFLELSKDLSPSGFVDPGFETIGFEQASTALKLGRVPDGR